MTLSIVALGTEAPIADAEVQGGETAAFTAADGTATITAMRGASVDVLAPGHDSATATVPDEGDLRVEMRPNVVSGVVSGPDGEPIAGVRVFMDGSELLTETDEDGAYELGGLPAEATLVYKVAGYRLVELTVGDELERDVTMEPFEARALYAPSAVFEAPGR
ncbi:MAG TPA: carboxypeptidase regulatory-like domain-containing protein, partial [Candidatus Limnocylindrales bacterium]|nr:carboxypeptidase regulatory-like domain-containing protein [Candidatus Limnocylindrales bacterium]